MVEIKYGEHYEVADLAGKSVAEVREQYKEELGIPDKAQASLDGKGIRKNLEPKIELNDDAELSFAEKSRRGLFFIGAMALAIAITGGIFAFTATSAGVMGTVATPSDYAVVLPAQEDISAYPPAIWKVSTAATGTLPDLNPIWKGGIGEVDAGDLFYIDPEDYTGDLSIRISLNNHDDLVTSYRFINMAVNLWYWDDIGSTWAQVTATQGIDMLNTTDSAHNYWLTLKNGEVILDGLGTDEYCVTIDRGSFYTFRGASATAPIFSCDVAQQGI